MKQQSTTTSRSKTACDYCRLKKAKCGAQRPCGNCVKKGIVCNFNPEDSGPPSKVDRSFNNLTGKIDQLDAKVSLLLNKFGSFQQPEVLNRQSFSISDSCSNTNTFPIDEIFNDTDFPSSISDDISYLLDSTPIDPQCLEFLNESFDINRKEPYIIDFIENASIDELQNNKMDIGSIVNQDSSHQINLSQRKKNILKENEYSFKGKIAIPASNLSFETSYTDHLIEEYLKHIYPFYPIVCEATIAQILEDLNKNGLQTSVSACQYYIVLALGEVCIADGSHEYWQNSFVSPPGFSYIWSALGIVEHIKLIEGNGFGTITIQLLLTVYFLKIGQLNDHRDELIKGAEMLFHFLEIEGHKHTHRDILLRLYWVFLHLERMLFNMELLDVHSSLQDIQHKIAIPRGCKTMFPKDADTFYSTCYMQSILLANLSDKAQNFETKGLSLNDSLRVFIKFEQELNSWRELLPFSFRWEDDATIRSTELEKDLLKLKYYMTYISVCRIVLDSYNKNETMDEIYKNILDSLCQKCYLFFEKATLIFKRQKIIDLDPFISHYLLKSFKFIKTFKKFETFPYGLVKTFSLHSPILDSCSIDAYE